MSLFLALQPHDAAAFDNSGNLWVLDGSNNRVLEFVTPFSNGMSASLVIGQPNFETNSPSITQSGIASGEGDLAIDSSGNIWVADFGINRVLEFRAPFSNGMNASLVIGQTSFVSGASSVGKSGLSHPLGVVFDSTGNLWVADHGNNRILEFLSPFSTGMNASVVMGQPDFTKNALAISQSGMVGPTRPAFDGLGNLWVPEADNNRALEFSSTAVPEFPTVSLAIVAVASLVVVALVLRKFPTRLEER